jgi:drug/metabolite transporter (DMT)-like permease
VTFLVVPVLAFEGIGPIVAMKRSASLIRDRWGQQITGDFVIGGIAGLVVWVGVILGVGGVILFIGGADPSAQIVGGLLTLVGVIIAVAGAVFAGATRGVFGVALYRYVAQDQTAGPFTESELASTGRAT